MATYYVAEGGTATDQAKENATSGTYPGGCLSPAGHNAETFSAGDEVLFSDEGGVIRAQITVPSSGSSGSHIVYGAKTGDSPVINGAELVTGWTPEGTANIWQATFASNPDNVYMDETWGDEKGSIGACVEEFDWYWSSNVLYVYAASDPDARYTSPGVEAVVRTYTIYGLDKGYLTFQDIECRYSLMYLNSNTSTFYGITVQDMVFAHCGEGMENVNGLWIRSADDVLVRRCDASYSGWNGIGVVSGAATTPLTNIIIEENHTWANGHNGIDMKPSLDGQNVIGPIIRFNSSHNNQSNGLILWNNDANGNVSIDDAKVYGNLFYKNSDAGINCGILGGSVYHDGCMFYNNTIYGNGLKAITYQGSGGFIKNNICFENQSGDTQDYEIYAHDGGGSSNTIDYNLVYHTSHTDLYYNNGTAYTHAEFQSFGQQLNGLNEDPLFVDEDNDDYTLASGSPCIGAAVNLGITYDDGLLPTSSWPDGVVTADRDNY